MLRRWGIVATVASACSFAPANNGDGGVLDAPIGTDAHDGGSGSGSGTLAACLSDGAYSLRPGSDHRYRVIGLASVASDLDRDGSFDACAADGGYLAQIADLQENDYIAAIGGANDAWIGLDDTVTEARFLWVNGSTSTYRHFQGGDPNDGSTSGSGEDCVYMGLTGPNGWSDTPCGELHPAVCECDATYVAPPTPACRTAPASDGWTSAQGRRYRYVTASRTWDDAEADCQSSGAYLMVPSDLRENSRINGQLGVGTRVWVGLRRAAGGSAFSPVDGEPAGFTHFGSGGLSTGSGRDCVVVVNPAGNWENHTCTDGNDYVCECDPEHPQAPE